MDLRLGCARTDCAPADQVSNVLWTDHVKEFGAGRQAELINIHQQLTRNAQPIIDPKTIVEEGIVD